MESMRKRTELRVARSLLLTVGVHAALATGTGNNVDESVHVPKDRHEVGKKSVSATKRDDLCRDTRRAKRTSRV